VAQHILLLSVAVAAALGIMQQLGLVALLVLEHYCLQVAAMAQIITLVTVVVMVATALAAHNYQRSGVLVQDTVTQQAMQQQPAVAQVSLVAQEFITVGQRLQQITVPHGARAPLVAELTTAVPAQQAKLAPA
jgi:hypothetical protein